MILILFFLKKKNKSYFIQFFKKQIIFYSTISKKSNFEIYTPYIPKIQYANASLALVVAMALIPINGTFMRKWMNNGGM